ncbi:MAG: PD-(D/E)XK nuclease family protein [Sulfuricurvum sp.]
MKDYFTYYDGSDVLPSGAFRISPSQVSRFLDSTSQWYREMLLGEAGFTGSTASKLGTCVHAAAAMYFDNKQVDYSAISSHIASITDPEIDKSIINSQVRIMSDTLINNFLKTTPATHSEWFIHTEITPGVIAAGSLDLYDQKRATIYDYKSMGSLDVARVPTSFPRNYWFQQLTYAYILRKNGHPVDYCKLVYVSRNNTGRTSEKKGKPLKDYPSTVNIVTHQITDEDMQIIENTLKLIADSVTLWHSNPELHHILAQDYRLRLPDKPKLFKD